MLDNPSMSYNGYLALRFQGAISFDTTMYDIYNPEFSSIDISPTARRDDELDELETSKFLNESLAKCNDEKIV